jgi:hypothetical protein
VVLSVSVSIRLDKVFCFVILFYIRVFAVRLSEELGESICI